MNLGILASIEQVEVRSPIDLVQFVLEIYLISHEYKWQDLLLNNIGNFSEESWLLYFQILLALNKI